MMPYSREELRNTLNKDFGIFTYWDFSCAVLDEKHLDISQFLSIKKDTNGGKSMETARETVARVWNRRAGND